MVRVASGDVIDHDVFVVMDRIGRDHSHLDRGMQSQIDCCNVRAAIPLVVEQHGDFES